MDIFQEIDKKKTIKYGREILKKYRTLSRISGSMLTELRSMERINSLFDDKEPYIELSDSTHLNAQKELDDIQKALRTLSDVLLCQ